MHVRLRCRLPVLVVFNVGKFFQRGRDAGCICPFADTADGFEFDESANTKDICQVVFRELADAGAFAALADQESVSDQGLNRNPRGWSGNAQLLRDMGVSNFSAGRVIAGKQAALQAGADSVCNSYCVDGHSETV